MCVSIRVANILSLLSQEWHTVRIAWEQNLPTLNNSVNNKHLQNGTSKFKKIQIFLKSN